MRPDFDDRARFLVELGRRLHIAGVSATRLEGAIRSVAQAIGNRTERLVVDKPVLGPDAPCEQ